MLFYKTDLKNEKKKPKNKKMVDQIYVELILLQCLELHLKGHTKNVVFPLTRTDPKF
jgi:hypothetical protein